MTTHQDVGRVSAFFRGRRRAGLKAALAVAAEAARLRGATTFRVLDIGGTSHFWRPFEHDLQALNAEVDVVNLAQFQFPDEPRVRSLSGDARGLPFASDSYDIVVSNSVIEHVGRWAEQKAMAAEVRRLAPAYYVQTPSFWFPIEPHFMVPIVHWLPEAVRADLLFHTRLGRYRKAESVDSALQTVNSITLLTARQFRTLFPDARFVRERVAGLTKSYTGVRSARSA